MTNIIHDLLIAPFREMLSMVGYYFPIMFSAVLVLVVGLLIANLLRMGLDRIFTEIKIDRLADTIGLTGFLHRGGIKHSFSHLISGLVYLVVIVSFLIMTAETLGVSVVSGLLGVLVAYIPQVVSAVFVLLLGLILAKIVGAVVYAIVTNLEMPKPKMHRTVTHWAIVIYAAKVALEELGFGFLLAGTTFHIWFGGLVLAIALAYGFGGRDAAAKHLGKK